MSEQTLKILFEQTAKELWLGFPTDQKDMKGPLFLFTNQPITTGIELSIITPLKEAAAITSSYEHQNSLVRLDITVHTDYFIEDEMPVPEEYYHEMVLPNGVDVRRRYIIPIKVKYQEQEHEVSVIFVTDYKRPYDINMIELGGTLLAAFIAIVFIVIYMLSRV